MRYALISDVHANLEALEAVLADIDARGDVDAVYHLGDLVGYSSNPNAVVGGGLGAAFTDAITIGIIAGLVAGKTVGIMGATWLVQRLTRARLADELAWSDVLGLSLLAGIGFTVSLLIGDLAFDPGSDRNEHVKVGVLTGSLLAAGLATVLLRARERAYRQLAQQGG